MIFPGGRAIGALNSRLTGVHFCCPVPRPKTWQTDAQPEPPREARCCFRPRSQAPCRSRNGWPNRTSCGRPGKSTGEELARAKRDATLLAVKVQEDAGIDIVTEGEQARQHFVHGFLENVEGIDFAHKVEMGIRNDRYKAMVPQVVGAAAPEGPRACRRGAARAHPHDEAS